MQPIERDPRHVGLFSAALKNTAANQLWRLLSGPLLLLLIPLYLSVEAQGYWYTFVSLGALAIFADLGFTAIIVQFTAHEFAHLHFGADNLLRGDSQARARLASLFRFASSWSFMMTILVVPTSYVLGLWLLGKGGEGELHWTGAWIIYSIACGINFLFAVLLAFLEGCDRVAEAHRLRLIVSVTNAVLLVVLLTSGAGLFALAISLLLSVLVGVSVLVFQFRPTLLDLVPAAVSAKANWRRELLPLLGRYAISWTSGYFILQLFAPLAFYFYGAADAGRIGLSMAIWMSVFSLSNVWIVVITPNTNMLISSGDVDQLLCQFRLHLRLAIATFGLGATALLLLQALMGEGSLISQRLLPLPAQVVLAIGWFFQLLVSALAMFIRAHKEEPLVMISVAMALQIFTTTTLLAWFFEVSFMVLGFTLAYLVWMPAVMKLYRNYLKRYE